MNAGKSLKEFLHITDVKKKDFAEAVGITQTYVSRLLKAEKWGADILCKSADYFNVSVSEFIEAGES